MTNRPYGFEFYNKVMRKWQLKDGQTQIAEDCPGEGWKQIPLSAWDYSGHKVVEFEEVKEVDHGN